MAQTTNTELLEQLTAIYQLLTQLNEKVESLTTKVDVAKEEQDKLMKMLDLKADKEQLQVMKGFLQAELNTLKNTTEKLLGATAVTGQDKVEPLNGLGNSRNESPSGIDIDPVYKLRKSQVERILSRNGSNGIMRQRRRSNNGSTSRGSYINSEKTFADLVADFDVQL